MRIITIAITAALVVCAVLALGGCESADNAAARRAAAEADQTRAAAEAYQQRQQADTAAAAERAAIRQAERDAAHERTLELLPYVITILGSLFLAALVAVLFWDLRSRPARPQSAPSGQARALPAPTINIWVLPTSSRRADCWREIGAVARREVTIYQDDRQ